LIADLKINPTRPPLGLGAGVEDPHRDHGRGWPLVQFVLLDRLHHLRPSVRTATRYYEKNLGWTAIPDGFAGGTLRHIGDDPASEAVPRCRALRLPDSLVEPPFEQFHPF
jgi:hypothetical protein